MEAVANRLVALGFGTIGGIGAWAALFALMPMVNEPFLVAVLLCGVVGVPAGLGAWLFSGRAQQGCLTHLVLGYALTALVVAGFSWATQLVYTRITGAESANIWEGYWLAVGFVGTAISGVALVWGWRLHRTHRIFLRLEPR